MGEIIEALRAKSTLLYMVDHRNEEKEVYQEYQRPDAAWAKH